MSSRQNRYINKQRFKLLLRWQIIIGSLFVVVFVLYGLYSYTMYSIGNKSPEVIVSKTGSLGDKINVKAIVLNDETTYYAPEEGYFENMVRENDRVRRNQVVGYFVSKSQARHPMVAITPGIYTTRTDGLEKVFANLNFDNLGIEVFHFKPSVNAGSREHCYGGYPVFKIVNNLNPTRLIIHYRADKGKLTIRPDQPVEIIYRDRKLGSGIVKKANKLSNEVALLAEMADFSPELVGQRYIEATCIFNIKSGYMVPLSAIVVKDSVPGVFYLNGQKVEFKAVRVLKKNNRMAVVEGLEANEMIIKSPGFFLNISNGSKNLYSNR
ncbi:MAG: HlyD family efflux transporter periplasmic adaptor subunit [Syntrophomonadaceae bacterium]